LFIESGGRVAVLSVAEHSTAAADGNIKPGDLLKEIDHRDIRGQLVPDIRQRVVGPPNTAVTLTFDRPGSATSYSVTLMRQNPHKHGHKVAALEVKLRETQEQLRLERIRREKAEALVIELEKEVTRLRTKLEQVRTQQDSLEMQAQSEVFLVEEQTKNRLTHAGIRLQAVERELADAKEMLVTQQNETARLATIARAERGEVEAHRDRLEQARERVRQLETTLSAERDHLEMERREAHAALRAKIDELEEATRSQAREATKVRSLLQHGMDEHGKALRERDFAVERLERAVEAENEARSKAEAAVLKMELQVEKVREEQRELEAAVAKAEYMAVVEREKAAHAQRSLEYLESQTKALLCGQTELTEELATERAARASAEEELRSVSRAEHMLRVEADHLRQDKDQAVAELNKLAAVGDGAVRDRRELKGTMSDLERDANALRKSLDQERATRMDAEQKAKEANAELRCLRQENKAMQTNKMILIRELDDMKRQLKSATDEKRGQRPSDTLPRKAEDSAYTFRRQLAASDNSSATEERVRTAQARELASDRFLHSSIDSRLSMSDIADVGPRFMDGRMTPDVGPRFMDARMTPGFMDARMNPDAGPRFIPGRMGHDVDPRFIQPGMMAGPPPPHDFGPPGFGYHSNGDQPQPASFSDWQCVGIDVI